MHGEDQEIIKEMIKFREEAEKQKLLDKTARMRRQIWLNIFLLVQQQLLRQVYEQRQKDQEEMEQFDDASQATALKD